MTATLHYAAKKHMRVLYKEHRWGVLTMLIMHADIRNRCWPSMRGLAHELGISPTKADAAKDWLLAHKAIELVPYDKRAGDERKLPARQHVYQLTGKVEIDGQFVPYLFSNPEVNVTNGSNLTPIQSTSEVTDGSNTDASNTTIGNRSIRSESLESDLKIPDQDIPIQLNPARAYARDAGEIESQISTIDLSAVLEPSLPVPPPLSPFEPEMQLILLAIFKVTGLDWQLVPDVLVKAEKYRECGYTAEDVAEAQIICMNNDWKWIDPKQGHKGRMMDLSDLTKYIGATRVRSNGMRYDPEMQLDAIIRRVRGSGDIRAVDPGWQPALEGGETAYLDSG